MSRKLVTLALVALGVLASSAMAAGDLPGSQRDVPSVASHDAGPAAAEPTDKELIEKQKVCPVMNKPLGSMGKPVKVTVKDRTVFLCCAGCKKKLLADPDKYLKKLDEKK